MISRPWLFTIVFAMLVNYSAAYGQKHINRFKKLNIEDGLSHGTIFAVTQDKLGFIWFGTNDGLNRYDGYDFKVFHNELEDPTSLSNSNISCLFTDSRQRLWIGTHGGGLNQYDFIHERFIRYQHLPNDTNSISSNSIRCIYEDAGGQLWIGTQEGLNQFDAASGGFTRYFYSPDDPNTLVNNAIWDIIQDHQGIYWLGTFNGLVRWDPFNNSLQHFKNNPKDSSSLSHNYVWTILEDANHCLWIGTFNGLNMLDSNRQTITRYFHISDPRASPPLRTNVWNSMLDSKGQLWFATLGSGLLQYSLANKKFTSFSKKDYDIESLGNNSIWALHEDFCGTIWMGTDDGANYFNLLTQNFNFWKHNPFDTNSLVHDFVWSIGGDSKHHIYIGTQNGLSILDTHTDQFQTLKHDLNKPGLLIDNYIRSLYTDSHENIWIGTNGGLSRFNPRKNTFVNYVNHYNDSTSISNNTIMDIKEDQNGIIWLATLTGINRLDTVTHKALRLIHSPQNPLSINHNYCYSLALDSAGKLWVGTENGLACIRTSTLKIERIAPDLPDSLRFDNLAINVVYLEDDRLLYLGTNKGLYIYNIETTQTSKLSKDDGLINDLIYGILKDKKGRLWLSTNDGLCRFNPVTREIKNYTIANGLPIQQFSTRAYYQDGNGKIYLGTPNGLIVFNPDSLIDNPCVPFLNITDFRIHSRTEETTQSKDYFNQSILFTDSFKLNYHQNTLSFRFTGLHYLYPAANQYAYMLEGIDPNWNYVSAKQRYVTYGQLPPGHYIFKVKGANPDGIWNQEIRSIHLIISPPFWQTLPFRFLMLIVSVMVIISIYRYRTHIIRNRNKILQTINIKLNEEIKERQGAERKLQTAQNFLQNLLNSLSSFIITIDLNQQITKTNLSAAVFFRIEQNPLSPQKIDQVLPFIKPFMEVIENVSSSNLSQELLHIPVQIERKNYYFNFSFYPLTNPENKGIVIRIDDVTELVHKEEQLRQAQKMDSLGILVGGLAHNFNNLLGGISGSLSLIQHLTQNNNYNPQKLKKGLNIIEIATSRATELVRDLLRMTRKQEFTFSSVDLNQAAENVLNICKNTFDKSIIIKYTPSDQPVVTKSDQGHIEQAILNLCINSAHALTIMRGPDEPQGGILSVAVSLVPTDTIFMKLFPDAVSSHYGCILIEDSGVGIDPAIREKIFDPFFSTKTEEQGTGLGLSTVYYIIHQHHGYINLYSTPGEGTSFKLYIPIINDAGSQSKALPEKPKEYIDGKGRRILIIDDEEIIRTTSRDILETFNYKILEADCGEKGIQLYQENSDIIDLILLDMAMPKLSGLEVYLSLKKINPKVKVILASGYRFDKRIDRTLAEGAVGFLPKPFTVAELLNMIQTTLGLT